MGGGGGGGHGPLAPPPGSAPEENKLTNIEVQSKRAINLQFTLLLC